MYALALSPFLLDFSRIASHSASVNSKACARLGGLPVFGRPAPERAPPRPLFVFGNSTIVFIRYNKPFRAHLMPSPSAISMSPTSIKSILPSFFIRL